MCLSDSRDSVNILESCLECVQSPDSVPLPSPFMNHDHCRSLDQCLHIPLCASASQYTQIAVPRTLANPSFLPTQPGHLGDWYFIYLTSNVSSIWFPVLRQCWEAVHILSPTCLYECIYKTSQILITVHQNFDTWASSKLLSMRGSDGHGKMVGVVHESDGKYRALINLITHNHRPRTSRRLRNPNKKQL